MPKDIEPENIDWLKRVTDKETEFSDLFARMDKDKALLIQQPYTMFDKDDREQPDVENITLNDAAVLDKTVRSRLGAATMQTVVAGDKMTDDETTFVEEFLRDFTLFIDDLLNPRDIPSLMGWNIGQICHRGRVGSRVTLKEVDGKLPNDVFLPMDTRRLVYEYGINGLKWFAYRTVRKQEKVWDEYKIDIGKTDAVVTDIWTDKEEMVFIDNKEEMNEKHDYGEPPAVIQVAPTGLMFMDDDRILHSGESIFALDRELYAEKHFFGSILKTITVMSFMGGLQYESKTGTKAKKPQIPPYGKKFVVPVDEGTRGYFNMPVIDIRNSARMFYAILDEALQTGALPKVSYGIYPAPASGVGMAMLKEAEDPMYYPRIQGLSLYYQRLYRMILKQYISLKLNLSLGEPGFKKSYPYKELDKEFSINFAFFMDSPKENMANISAAAAVGDLVSDDTKRRDYLQLKDPDAEDAKKWAEKAPRLSPAVAKYKIIESLIKQDKMIEANLMAQELGMSIDQIMSGRIPEASPEDIEVKPKQLMPMFAGGGPAGGKPPEEEVVAEEEQEGGA